MSEDKSGVEEGDRAKEADYVGKCINEFKFYMGIDTQAEKRTEAD